MDLIQVSLGSAILPSGIVGSSYRYDLSQHLLVSGDPQLDLGLASWSVGANLPAGLNLTVAGVIEGTPTAENVSGANVQVTARYRTKTAVQTYSLPVISQKTIVLQPEGYRTWSDNTVARSCNEYRNPTAGRTYAGSVGDGLYRIQPTGQAVTTVYCDMTNGGYTLLGRAVYGQVHNWPVAYNGLNIPSTPSPTSNTFKYSDAFFNAVPKTVYKVASTAAYAVTLWWNGACVYSQAATTDQNCMTSYTSEALTTVSRVGAYGPNSGGLHDRPASGGFHLITSLPVDQGYGWAGGGASNDGDTGTGSAGSPVTLIIWAK